MIKYNSMIKKSFYLFLFCILVGSLGISCTSTDTAEDQDSSRPNVVFILTDDQRWDAVSASGIREHPQTPRIDQLAEEGVFFENAFVTTSICSPARASFLSGLYAHTHGVTGNFIEFPDELPTFPRVLQTEGYNTAYIGKWHMGEDNSEPRPGFDHFITHKGQGNYFDTAFNINGQGDEVVEGYYTHVVTDMAIDWLARDRGDQPFMLALGHKAPHSFYFPEPAYENAHDHVVVPYPRSSFDLDDKPAWIKERMPTWHGIYGPLFEWREEFPDSSAAGVVDFENMVRAYWSVILSIDDSVGEIYDYLEETGEMDNTIFIFAGDNGILEGEHGMVDKRTAHEPSIRIPLIIRYPGLTSVDEPVRVEEQVLNLDLAPSILELTHSPVLEDIHGQSFVDVVRGNATQWRDAWYYEYNYEVQFPYTPNVRAIRTDEWKYIRYPHGDGSPDRHMAELYNLVEDPNELNNLINDPQYGDLIEELRTRLDELIEESGAVPDEMPLDQGIGTELPEESIR